MTGNTLKPQRVSRQLGQPEAPHNFTVQGTPTSEFHRWFVDNLRREILNHGHELVEKAIPDIRLVLNVTDAGSPQPFRRGAQATFVCTIVELPAVPADIFRVGYPILIRTLANLVIMIMPENGRTVAHFVTPERGHYAVSHDGDERRFFDEIYDRVEPLASSQLVINNIYLPTLEQELWNGDEQTRQISRAGKNLGAMDLLPAPFPIHELLSDREMRHVKRLYGLGGLSYGNLSARRDDKRFWMSASGVDKARLEVVGQDILLVADYDSEQTAIVIQVPPNVTPRRVSVDAIEHWMIYREHPQIGAIVHVHGWIDGIVSTEFNYPCGTIQLAKAVADLLREEEDPAHAVIGLKNHGVTITGRDMDEIFQRIEGKILSQVPMM